MNSKIWALVIVFTAMFGKHLRAQSVFKTMKHLPDSGELAGYTATPGEDNDYTIYAPFFVNNGNGTVTDTVTGLMWQRTDGGEMTIEQARIYCDTLTLGGYTDWRLPSAHEGFSILNLNYLNPALDTAVFTANTAGYWWSADMQADDTTNIWVTNAGGGIGNHPRSETISAGGIKSFHVRAVRDITPPPLITAHFTDNSNGTIADDLTGLMWQQVAAPDTLTWEQALSYADTLSFAGYTDWRLPNIKELESINDETVTGPSTNVLFLNGTGGKFYWSSTTQENVGGNAWYLSTQYGITTYADKARHLFVLCVRGNAANVGLGKVPVEYSGSVIYPNPVRSNAVLLYQNNGKELHIILISSEGRIVYDRLLTGASRGMQRQPLDLAGMPAGVYSYEVVEPGNNFTPVSAGRIVVE